MPVCRAASQPRRSAVFPSLDTHGSSWASLRSCRNSQHRGALWTAAASQRPARRAYRPGRFLPRTSVLQGAKWYHGLIPSRLRNMRYVLALDQGTTSSRAIIFDEGGRPVIICHQEFPQYFPRPGWVEHDPVEIWKSQLAVARQALRDARLHPEQISAIGIANQRETTIMWDRTNGQPICRAIVWQDRRTAEACDAIKGRGLEPLITEKTGLLLDPYFSATKIAWILDNVPGARRKAEAGSLAFGPVDSWLLWQ